MSKGIKIFSALVLQAVIVLGQTYAPKLSASITFLPSPIERGKQLSGEFSDAMGQVVNLPTEGRYLLWIVDAAFALEEREEVSEAEFDPTYADNLLYNPTVLTIPQFDQFKDTKIIFTGYYTDLPLRDERLQVVERFPDIQVLFNDQLAFSHDVKGDGFVGKMGIQGLLFMEGQRIKYVYPLVSDKIIQEAAKAFLNGEEPSVFPLNTGDTLPDFPSFNKPSLIVSIYPYVLEVTPDSAYIQVTNTPDGGSITETKWDHVGAISRFILETLPAALAEYEVQLVAMSRVTLDPEEVEALKETFPEWEFIFLATPEENLAWGNIYTRVVDKNGVLHRDVALGIGLEEDLKNLIKALEEVSSQ